MESEMEKFIKLLEAFGYSEDQILDIIAKIQFDEKLSKQKVYNKNNLDELDKELGKLLK